MSEWQTMESVPSAKCVLLGKVGQPMVVCAYRPQADWKWRHAHAGDYICFEPDRWHPLPAPPTN